MRTATVVLTGAALTGAAEAVITKPGATAAAFGLATGDGMTSASGLTGAAAFALGAGTGLITDLIAAGFTVPLADVPDLLRVTAIFASLDERKKENRAATYSAALQQP